MKNVWLAVTLFICLPGISWAQQQKKDRKAEIKKIVEAQSYVFKAQTALPTAGAIRQLTSDYDLRISKDTIVSDLPYFGRAFTAPLNPSEGPLQFTTTNFQYTISSGKKGSWRVSIAPKDRTDPRELFMTIFDNGSASVVVNSNNRQPISFNGYITSRK